MTRPPNGKVALVTGAGRGLRRACAQLFARDGAKSIVAELDSRTGAQTVQHIRDAGSEPAFVESDVSQPDQIEAMVGLAVDRIGARNAFLASPLTTFLNSAN